MPADFVSVAEQEAQFIRQSLAAVDKSGRYVQIRLWIVRTLAIAAGLWFAFDRRHASTLLDVECTVVLILGLIMGVCTERIRSTMNSNTKAVLQALEEAKLRA